MKQAADATPEALEYVGQSEAATPLWINSVICESPSFDPNRRRRFARRTPKKNTRL